MDSSTATTDTHDDQPQPSKSPGVVRGAIACTVCRTAKMKCIPGESGKGKCQRCERTGSECVFEKHRRGRKKGSTLSDASKMLRQVEKGLISRQRLSTLSHDAAGPSDRPSTGDSERDRSANAMGELHPMSITHPVGSGSGSDEDLLEDDDVERERQFFPAQMIKKENVRNSYFGTILNPEPPAGPPASSPIADQTMADSATQDFKPPIFAHEGIDPVSAGILDLSQAGTLLELIFIRLNPFINLFDPALHTVSYIRERSPFLFTTLMMAGAKFFKPQLYQSCKKMAHDMAIQAFSKSWKSVEVVQAFACLTYWKDPEDNFTWTYIGYAARMAVELGLNRYYATPPPGETSRQLRERRNRERTYLVLFVHDRSLSTQTGRNWMLPVCDLVAHSHTWHEEGDSPIRPEDIIVAAFVQLRQVAADTTDWFRTSGNEVPDMMLRTVNNKLTQWIDTWTNEMKRKDVASAMQFHFSFLAFFHNYVKLFLNSFGIQQSPNQTSRTTSHLQALSQCYTCAMEVLQIVVKDFSTTGVLRYGQDSTVIMTAYAAVFLLKLLRSSPTLTEIYEGVTEQIYSTIRHTAEAYQNSPILPEDTIKPSTHARFLHNLVAHDIMRTREQAQFEYGRQHSVSTAESSHSSSPDSRTQHAGPSPEYGSFQFSQAPNSAPIVAQGTSTPQAAAGPSHGYSQSYSGMPAPAFQGMRPPTDNRYSVRQVGQPSNVAYHSAAQSTPSEVDATYWRSMWTELGFGGSETSQTYAPMLYMPDDGMRGIPPHPSAHSHATVSEMPPQPSRIEPSAGPFNPLLASRGWTVSSPHNQMQNQGWGQ